MTFAAGITRAKTRLRRLESGADNPTNRVYWEIMACWKAPSLNELQTVALITQLVTLACGTICLASGDRRSKATIASGWIALCSTFGFALILLRYLRIRCQRPVTQTYIAPVNSTMPRDTDLRGSMGRKPKTQQFPNLKSSTKLLRPGERPGRSGRRIDPIAKPK